MADLNKIINIQVNFGEGKIKIDNLTTSIKNLDQANKNLANTMVSSVQPAFIRTEQVIKNEVAALTKQRGAIASTSIQYMMFTDRIEQLNLEMTKLQGRALQNATVGVNNLGKGFKALRNDSGLASQTLIEVGRTVSDANYGFTAVANNLSQLTTYFVTLVDQSKGFKGALSSLGKQMMGAGGVVIALQIVITLIEKFSLEQKKAKDATEDLNKSLEEQADKINLLSRAAFGDENYIAALKRNFSELAGYLDNLNELERENYQFIKIGIDAQKDLIQVRIKQNAKLSELNKLKEQESTWNKTTAEYTDALAEAESDLIDLYLKESKLLKILNVEKQKDVEITSDAIDLDKKRKDSIEALLEKAKELAKQTAKTNKQGKEIVDAELKRSGNAFSEYISRKKKEKDIDVKINEFNENQRQKRLSDEAEYAKALGSIVSGVADNIDAAYQKELDIEQNKTNAINNQLRDRLKNENLSADERKKIQNKIAANDEALRIKQEKIEKERFKANKTAAIAEATISTFLAANKVLSSTDGGSVARIAGMIAVIAAGLANVAMISKSQFKSSTSNNQSLSSVSTSSAQSTPTPPLFNVVGRSNVNQLAETIAGQSKIPIKTYVVAKDVSTAQELDRNIIESATL